ncbi:hypothetical protein CRG98_038114 [Punica granatum]|uniref:Uncharacterized protein n=1 Tax=Punica granatum TaxID=22663 RepID=A0A2I0IBY3_PUNGR|nr:hypothetical protein CRG98_038114 [Punica granatum]
MSGSQVQPPTRTTADSDFRPLGIRRRSTPELESLIARPGHPQQTTIAPAIKPAPGRVTSNRPSSKVGFRQVKHTATPGAEHRQSNFIAMRMEPQGASPPTNPWLPRTAGRAPKASEVVKGCATPFKPTMFKEEQTIGDHHQSPRMRRSFRSKFRSLKSSRSFGLIRPNFHSFGSARSIPVIQVHPSSCIRVHPGHIQVYPGLSAFGSIPVIQVYPGLSAFGSIPVSFGSIPVLISRAMSHYIQARHEQPWGNVIRAVAGRKKGMLLIIFGYIL